MTTTPQEGGPVDQRSTAAIVPQTYRLEVKEWTDGQINIYLYLETQSARYRVEFSRAGFMAFVEDALEVLVQIIKQLAKGR